MQMVEEFLAQPQARHGAAQSSVPDQWADQFGTEGYGASEWADQFANQLAAGTDVDSWMEDFAKEMDEQVAAQQGEPHPSQGPLLNTKVSAWQQAGVSLWLLHWFGLGLHKSWMTCRRMHNRLSLCSPAEQQHHHKRLTLHLFLLGHPSGSGACKMSVIVLLHCPSAWLPHLDTGLPQALHHNLPMPYSQ